jgi:hypothetical protein
VLPGLLGFPVPKEENVITTIVVGAVLVCFFAVSMFSEMWLSTAELRREETLEALAFAPPPEPLILDQGAFEPEDAGAHVRPAMAPSHTAVDVPQESPIPQLVLNI